MSQLRSRALYYDCFSGISGDMHLGALLDIGVPAEHLTAELGRLELADEFTLRVEPASKMGITGTRASVALHPDATTPHRHLRDIQQIIDSAQYDPAVRDRALAMFREIAVAEAKVHGTTIDEVHFHEVGATDSIVDIVGASIGLEFLNLDELLCNTVELGAGMVTCAHGVFPVPAMVRGDRFYRFDVCLWACLLSQNAAVVSCHEVAQPRASLHHHRNTAQQCFYKNARCPV